MVHLAPTRVGTHGLIANRPRTHFVVEKAKRLETANLERAEAAVRWENDDNTARETHRPADVVTANASDRALTAADRKIKSIESEP